MRAEPLDLDRLLAAGPNAQVDMLPDNASLGELAATLSAFANDKGGTLLVGVARNGTLGVADEEETIDRVLQAAIISLEPPLIIPLPESVPHNNRWLVVVRVPPGMPHVYAADGTYYRRDGAANSVIGPRELRRLIVTRGQVSFESEVAHGASLDDINWDHARDYADLLGGYDRNDPRRTLERRGCLAVVGGELRPTYAGLLLFGIHPQRYLQSADIIAARFAGDTMTDRFSRQDITGALPEQIRRAETFLADHLRRSVHLTGSMARTDDLEYPMEAARELLVNAVAHRDYSVAGDNVRLFIFRDRLEVTSPGGLPGPVTVANIRDERFSRNPIIVQVLADMGFVERLGYGVDRVFTLMAARGRRPPTFTETAGGFRVMLHAEAMVQPVPTANEGTSLRRLYPGVVFNPRQVVALRWLHDGHDRITNSELQAMCPDVTAETLRRDLSSLVKQKILDKVGEKRATVYMLRNGGGH